MTKKAKQTSMPVEQAVETIVGVIQELHEKCDRLEHENTVLKERSPTTVDLPAGATPINTETLDACGLVDRRYYEGDNGRTHPYWAANFGRLTIKVQKDGRYNVSFSATFGGSIGTYRALKTIEELRCLMELLGFKSEGSE